MFNVQVKSNNTLFCYHNGATVSSQRRLQQLGEDRVSVGDVDALPAHGHVSQGAAGDDQT